MDSALNATYYVLGTMYYEFGTLHYVVYTACVRCMAESQLPQSPAPTSASAIDRPFRQPPNMVLNTAFVFIKPHAVTEPVKKLVGKDLTAKGFKIEREGSITAKQIDEGKLVRWTNTR